MLVVYILSDLVALMGKLGSLALPGNVYVCLSRGRGCVGGSGGVGGGGGGGAGTCPAAATSHLPFFASISHAAISVDRG